MAESSSEDEMAGSMQDFFDVMDECSLPSTLPSRPPCYPGITIFTDAMPSTELFEQHRNIRPFVLGASLNPWEAVDQWAEDSALRALDCLEDPPVYTAHDNTHFLKHELTSNQRRTWAEGIDCVLRTGGKRAYLRTGLRMFGDRLQGSVPVGHIAQMCAGEAQQGSEDMPAPFKESNCGVWVSSPGCVTPLHYDLCHGFLAQIRGSKRVLLFAPTDLRSLYPNAAEGPNPNTSQVDVARWLAGDEQQRSLFPKVANADPYEHVLRAGECLYIPPFWWHHVSTLQEPAASVLLPFDPDYNRNEGVHPCVED
eukprot:TRINITY_DN7741_c0_g1_i1.p1 TRINITY_DN7741_c0_g1~~TRINITY_DN7741_c0_g1_i1.p1  ORF type:complete len:310 (-),score=48.78 TRINITY_DN7741_c0_g1_i1:204-1133(-)